MPELTKKQKYIKSILPKTPEIEGWVDNIVQEIHRLGEMFGTHKYDIWLAKEIKKDESILDRVIDVQLVIDWALETKADILSLNFSEALISQEEWHNNMVDSAEDKMAKIPEINKERVIYITSDQKFFLYVLDVDDLQYEGTMMNHCVKGKSYKTKVKSKKSLILSLRDVSNRPHVTLEIAFNKSKSGEFSGRVVQQYGKANKTPKPEYKTALKECILFMCDCIDEETEKFLDMNYF